MNDGKNNTQLTTQLQQQSQERNGINPARNGNSNALPSTEQLFLPNVRQQAKRKGMHENMVQQRPCENSRPRLAGRAKLDWVLISVTALRNSEIGPHGPMTGVNSHYEIPRTASHHSLTSTVCIFAAEE
jgi:hypothetical protein